jgi:CheY-like chemotaxis protein
MNVAHCLLADLREQTSRTTRAGGRFDFVIGDAGSDDLVGAFTGFQSLCGCGPTRLLLITPDPQASLSSLTADAVLATPIRPKLLKSTMTALLSGGTKALETTMSLPPGVSVRGLPLKVLVTDDNLINLKLACALLTRLGCDVATADSGEDALRKVSGTDYALVFMDCVMPGMDGFAATAAIRNLAGKCSGVPIVALTASATAEDREHCLAVGMDDFLTKPIRSEQLAKCLNRWARVT